MFLIAESLSRDFSMFPEETSSIHEHVRGLVPTREVEVELQLLGNMDIDSYIDRVVAPAEDPNRVGACAIIADLGRISEEERDGPYYSAVVDMEFDGDLRQVGFIVQDRAVQNGAWMPEHHLAAARCVDEFSKRAIPIVSLMDTPGADGGAEANRHNQAHSISHLIAEMCNVDVPNLGIIFGLGYSGGAIPLAASNLILSVRDGVFSTIQPRGLAHIARRLNLSWQECAKYVGLSPYELCTQGNIDGVIDYVPGEKGEQLENFRAAITSGIVSVEHKVMDFVRENPYIFDHYRRSLQRYLSPSERLQRVQTSASLSRTKSPTEYSNVFGVAYRYLRYLGIRKRIHATTTAQYGRLAKEELPRGQLAVRAERERQLAFVTWLQDPEKIIYDDQVSRSWKNYQEKKQAVHDERGRIAQLIFGEPKKNYEEARASLVMEVGVYLYCRWKGEARGNLSALSRRLKEHADTRRLLQVTDVNDAEGLLDYLRRDMSELSRHLRSRFTHEGKKLLRAEGTRDKSEAFVLKQLASELNLVISGPPLEDEVEGDLGIAPSTDGVTGSSVAVNREILDRAYALYLSNRITGEEPVPFSDLTLLDALLSPELREEFENECQDLLLFDAVYDQIIANLVSIADEADSTRAFSQETIGELLDRCIRAVADQSGIPREELDEEVGRLRERLVSWFKRLSEYPRRVDFLRGVEEWKKALFPQLSDTLLVVVTYLFERLIPSYLSAEEGKRYDGRIAPRNIGRRKDFWNRLTIAYRDLLIQEVLELQKRKGAATHTAFIETFFEDFEEVSADLLSADPCGFPGFRVSIEDALKRGLPPCGIVTGIGEIRGEKRSYRVGAVISNVRFQAGSFDMASAEKFCHLLVECAQQRLPVVCFISSGGMQTKEGAGALFSMAAVNDRITRFVRDNDLPVIVFGFGDCTGGAQASFVTHPLVQTYYFSGTSMPFAGQIVVQENLPFTSTLSNYLSQESGAMQGLVKHPFAPNLDEALQRVDPDIPVPAVTVEEVVDWVMEGSVAERPAMVATRERRVLPETLERPVKRVLVHARGCTAVKLISVAQRENIEVVLVASDPDMDSVAVDMLGERDRVICIGGNTPDESYLNAMSVVRVGEHEEVDSLHPGIGFLSESSQFAELCRSHGINFIGPPVSSMEAMGNKSNAINTARRLGVPVVPGSHGILTDVERASEVAASIGYPVLIKAVHGGGGKGIQVVERSEDFHELFQRVSVEARAAFGNGDVYLEKFVQRLRHIEVQVLRDMSGTTKVLGLRDCTVQRDKQKVFEESDSMVLASDKREDVLRYTVRLADEVGYTGAGTVEFIYDLDADEIYFMEMNTRLQIEHPVTERVSGVDIVREQFRIAGGEEISQLEVKDDGYAMEARINAERVVVNKNGALGFRPDPGLISECVLPQDDAIEVIAAIADGKSVSPFYDSMIVQIIAHGRDRTDAIAKLEGYLGRVRIHGVSTNIPLLLRVLADDAFVTGCYDTNYLTEFLKRVDAEALQREFEAFAGVPTPGFNADTIRIDGSDELKVLAPSTGIFYITPSPSDPEYVSVGDLVDVRHTLGQMEAMKIFTPLSLRDFNNGDDALYPDDQSYEVTRINMTNGQQVNAGDLLFVVRPIPIAA